MITRKRTSEQDKGRKGLKRAAQLAASLLLVGNMFMSGPASWAAPTQKLSDIDRVEKKLFQSVDSKRSMPERLDRIEKRVFGEAKEGTDQSRMAAIMEVVPDLEEEEAPQQASSSPSSSSSDSNQQNTSSTASSASNDQGDDRADAGTEYPAVSAIEKKLYGRDYHEEPVNKRLARLETKVFGKVSSSDDLSERTDALKSRTGVDVARNAPLGTDWADEDEADIDFPESAPISQRSYSNPLQSSPGADGMSFSGRNMRQDFEKAFGRRPGGPGGFSGSGSSGGSGSYGMSGSGSGGRGYSVGGGNSSSGSYGFGGSSSTIGGGDMGDNDRRQLAYTPGIAPGRSSSMPPTAPPIRQTMQSGGGGGAPGMGLNEQVQALENEIFGKSYRDALPSRIERLEQTVFPNGNSRGASLQARVAKLTAVVPISSPHTVAQNAPFNNNDPDDQDMSDPPAVYNPSSIDPSAQIPGQRKGGGFGKILNSLGSFIGGGMSVGGFPMQSGNLYTDPQTGLLVDRLTGNMIDPNSGMVISRRTSGYPGAVPGYGSSFNNGFSPYYRSPYSSGMGGMGGGMSGFGMGGGMGSGMGFGTGFGSGGMWP